MIFSLPLNLVCRLTVIFWHCIDFKSTCPNFIPAIPHCTYAFQASNTLCLFKCNIQISHIAKSLLFLLFFFTLCFFCAQWFIFFTTFNYLEIARHILVSLVFIISMVSVQMVKSKTVEILTPHIYYVWKLKKKHVIQSKGLWRMLAEAPSYQGN